MLLRIDANRHAWFQDDRYYDLSRIMDDAPSEIYYVRLSSVVVVGMPHTCPSAAIRRSIHVQIDGPAIVLGIHDVVTAIAGEVICKLALSLG
jgi:hypothetical protein